VIIKMTQKVPGRSHQNNRARRMLVISGVAKFRIQLLISYKQKVVKAITGTARQIISLSAQAVRKRSSPPTKSNESHSDLGLENPPVSRAYAWKSVQSDIGKGQELQERCQLETRLVDGREAVRLGTKAQQLHIIRRFEDEIRKTPLRKKVYQEAIDRAMDDGVELKTDSGVEENKLSSVKDGVIKVDDPHYREGSVEATEASSSSQAIEEKNDDVFAREIELAKQLSLDSAYV
jgi:hypothetical protein